MPIEELMRKGNLNILIVEDDVTQGQALFEVVKRAGYNATLCPSAAHALTAVQRNEFHCLIVDCMLPKMNGVTVVGEIQKILNNGAKVIMYSGIFKDKNFIKETLSKTGAVEFFTKPLPIERMMAVVDEALQNTDEPVETGILALYQSRHIADDHMITLMNKESTFHAFHLPMLYQRMQETELTGELTLVGEKGDTYTVSFIDGHIFAVRTPDKESYFGAIAINLGFVPPDELAAALANNNGKMLGQKLIDSQSLSPHAIQLIMEEQLVLRTSQTVQPGLVSISFASKKLPVPEFKMNGARFEALIHDWLTSKIDGKWMMECLQLWSNRRMEGDFSPRITDASTIEEIIKHPEFDPDHDARSLFQSLLDGQAFIGGGKDSAPSLDYFATRIDKLLEEYKSQNHFQVLGIGEKAQMLEVNKAFASLREYFDPDKLPESASKELREKCTKMFSYVKASYYALSDDARRNHYISNLQKTRNNEAIASATTFQAAVTDLQMARYEDGAKKLQSIIDRKVDMRDLRAYRIWAGLRMDRTYKDFELEQISPEERHSSAYAMARGVRYTVKGQFEKALDAFKTAHVLDPSMNIARRELLLLQIDALKTRPSEKSLHRDIANTIETFYGKNAKKAA